MKVKINFPDKKSKLALLELQLKNINVSLEVAESRLTLAGPKAEDMARYGYDHIEAIYNQDKSTWIDAFNSDPVLHKWFGSVTKESHVKKVRDRMKGIFNHVFNGYTIGLKPENDNSPLAITMGVANITNTRFRVYPSLIKRDIWEIAETIIHEIGHQWFTDQKLGSTKVYGEVIAGDLAKYDPTKARRSTENYSIFCAKIHQSKGKRVKGKGYFKASIEL
ncbi:MAG TPA: hypothetical protein VFM79_02275 [Pelobium sp.]|nr:hypothetical protein [Pelobium sp.]